MDSGIEPFAAQQGVTVICAYPDPVTPTGVQELYQFFLVGPAHIEVQADDGVWLRGTKEGDMTGPFDPVSGWQLGEDLGGVRMRLVRE